ncbi:MAG: aspartate aminotransferase family protein [Lewinellaceae bacterium]|nr:aspartate aminotransferase family protein [Saprospiraceae bacterium]MCB9339721.1 aspartate aminotransferase family protein [Lewinellaceae bacterium]
MNTESTTQSKTTEILEKQKKYLWPNHLLYYTEPLPLERGDGLYVWDVEGKRYLDFFGGILTTSVGHNRPEVVQAVQQQTEKLIHSSTLYPNEAHVNLAEKMAELAPGKLQVSYFTATGSDADETAVFLAKTHTGYQEIIALRHGYSGRSAMGMSLTGQHTWRIGGTHVLGIKHALNPYCYRCPLKMTYPGCGVACAQDIEDTIKTTTSGRIAAFIAEPIQGVGGFITPPKEYFKIAKEIVKNYGGLFIADEVQTGFGRTGDKWFGIEHWEVEPDIMTMAKSIANGFPLANTITTPEIAECTRTAGLTISTFGGNPVSCAASLAAIGVLEKEASPQHVAHLGKMFRSGLDRLQEKYAVIGDVRGMGLMQGLELVKDRQTKEPSPEATKQLFEATRELGLLIGKGGLYGNVIRISPPMTATEEDVAVALDLLDKGFGKISRT